MAHVLNIKGEETESYVCTKGLKFANQLVKYFVVIFKMEIVFNVEGEETDRYDRTKSVKFLMKGLEYLVTFPQRISIKFQLTKSSKNHIHRIVTKQFLPTTFQFFL